VVAVGGAASVIVKKGKCRNVGLAALLGFSMGLVAWVTSFVVIWQYRASHLSIVSYLQIRAKVGLSIGHIGSSSSNSPPISGIFMDILWGVEGICFLAGSAMMAARRARIPFCEACQDWAEHVKLKFTMERPTAEAVAAVTKAQGVAEVVPDRS